LRNALLAVAGRDGGARAIGTPLDDDLCSGAGQPLELAAVLATTEAEAKGHLWRGARRHAPRFARIVGPMQRAPAPGAALLAGLLGEVAVTTQQPGEKLFIPQILIHWTSPLSWSKKEKTPFGRLNQAP
jgi:hypothetical protein